MSPDPASTAGGLGNEAFYQTAAALFGVLLLTGVVAELRSARERAPGEPGSGGEASQLTIFMFLGLSLLVLVGEMASMTVLLRQQDSPLLRFVVGATLILGLLGVPGLAAMQVLQTMDKGVRRIALRAAWGSLALAMTVVGGFVLQSLISGKLGVGAPNAGGKPAATSGPAANVTARTAVLLGQVEPNGAPTTYVFQYGRTGIYGVDTPTTIIADSTGIVRAVQPIRGLRPAAVYHYRLVANNEHGTARGPDRVFKTKR